MIENDEIAHAVGQKTTGASGRFRLVTSAMQSGGGGGAKSHDESETPRGRGRPKKSQNESPRKPTAKKASPSPKKSPPMKKGSKK